MNVSQESHPSVIAETNDQPQQLPEAERESSSTQTPFRWKTNLVLFVLTVISTFLAGAAYAGAAPEQPTLMGWLRMLSKGWSFAVPLLAILLFHEFGHYFAARIHRVQASLPYFIPLPLFSPLGTMGAVISMKGRIKSRNALLDIGASGPLAGLAVAIPVLVIGLMHSEVKAMPSFGYQEGQSLFYLALKWLVLRPMSSNEDVFLNPVAFAGWAGILITMLNLLPVGQLDGGHIAYALFGPKQNRYARILHTSLLAIVGFNLLYFLPAALRENTSDSIGQAVSNSVFWLMWFILIHVLFRLGGRDHPPTEPGELSPARKVVAVVSLLLFVLLFMPTPMAAYGTPTP